MTLDEADKMIEMDLEESVNFIINSIPSQLAKSDEYSLVTEQESQMMQLISFKKQFMMFSATMQPAIASLAKKYLKNPVQIQIGELGSAKKEIE